MPGRSRSGVTGIAESSPTSSALSCNCVRKDIGMSGACRRHSSSSAQSKLCSNVRSVRPAARTSLQTIDTIRLRALPSLARSGSDFNSSIRQAFACFGCDTRCSSSVSRGTLMPSSCAWSGNLRPYSVVPSSRPISKRATSSIRKDATCGCSPFRNLPSGPLTPEP